MHLKVVWARGDQFLAVAHDVTPGTLHMRTPGYLLDAVTHEVRLEANFPTILAQGYWKEVEPFIITTKDFDEAAHARDERGRFMAMVSEHEGVYHRAIGRWGQHKAPEDRTAVDKLHHTFDVTRPHRHTKYGAIETSAGHIAPRHVVAKDFAEDAHPRDEHGRFTTGGEAAGQVITPRMRANADKWFADHGIEKEALQRQLHDLMGRADADTVAKGMGWYDNAHWIADELAQRHGLTVGETAGVLAALSPRVKWSDCASLTDDCGGVTYKNSNQDQADRVLDTLGGRYGTTHEITSEQAAKVLEADQNSTAPARNSNPLDIANYNGVDESKHGMDFTGSHDIKDLPADVLAATHGAVVGAIRESATKAIQCARGENPDDVLGGSKVRSFYNNIAHPGETDNVTVDGHQARAMLGSNYVSDKVTNDTIGTIARYDYMAQAVREVAAERGLRPDQVQAITWGQWREEHPAEDRRANTVATSRMLATSGAKEILQLRDVPNDLDAMDDDEFTALVQQDNAIRMMGGTKENPNHDERGRFASGPSGGVIQQRVEELRAGRNARWDAEVFQKRLATKGELLAAVNSAPEFFHGTSRAQAEQILKEGLRKDIGVKNWTGIGGGVASEEGRVYLTTDPKQANFFGSMVAMMHDDPSYVVLEIKIPEDAVKEGVNTGRLQSDPNMDFVEKPNCLTYQGDIKPEWIQHADVYSADPKQLSYHDDGPVHVKRLKDLGGGKTLYMPVSLANARRLLGGTKDWDEALHPRDEQGKFSGSGISNIEGTDTFKKLVDAMAETNGSVLPPSDYTKPQNEVASYWKSLPGNQDPVLSMLVHEKGFDAAPKLVSAEELDRQLAAGAPELWRGVTSTVPDFENNTRESIHVDSAGELLRGDYYAGKGAYGNGTYFAGADASNGTDRFEAARFASDFGDQIVRGTLSPDAKVADWDAMTKEMVAERRAFNEKTDYGREGVTREYAQAVDHMLQDQGRYALAKGYDAFRVDAGGDTGVTVVLNRGALIMEDKVYSQDEISVGNLVSVEAQ